MDSSAIGAGLSEMVKIIVIVIVAAFAIVAVGAFLLGKYVF